MTNRKDATQPLIRTSVLITKDIDKGLRELARRGKRPLSWEIRDALERHVRERTTA